MGTKEIEELIAGKDVKQVLDERKSRQPREAQDKELEVFDNNHLSTPFNLGLEGHTGRARNMSDYQKNSLSGGRGLGSMEKRLDQQILNLFTKDSTFEMEKNSSITSSAYQDEKESDLEQTMLRKIVHSKKIQNSMIDGEVEKTNANSWGSSSSLNMEA